MAPTKEVHVDELGFDVAYELMDDGDSDAPSVADQQEAERHLKAVRYWRKRLAEVQAHAKAERDIVDRWERSETDKIAKRLQWHEFGLTAWLRTLGKPSWKGIWGSVRRFAGRESINVTDGVVFAEWAKTNAPNLLRVKVEPDKAEIKGYISASGEQPPGVEITTGEATYKVDVTEG